MYYVASNIVTPLTERSQLSYAELVGPKRVEWFVSHYWGRPFKDFVASLRKHAEHETTSLQTQRCWKDVTFWVCTLSNNQWDVKATFSCRPGLTHCKSSCITGAIRLSGIVARKSRPPLQGRGDDSVE